MRKIGGLLMLVVALIYGTPDAKAADMSWPIVNSSSYKVEVQFFSRSRNAVWPAGGRVWYAFPGQQITPVLRCNNGEYICYGAWPAGSGTLFWGVGRGGQQGCSSCCFTCVNGYVGGHTLR
jgi:hypothetical protein